MSFNRLKYDSTAFNNDVKSNKNQGDYRLFELYSEHPNKCLPMYKPSKSNSSDTKKEVLENYNLTDLESELTFRTNKLKKDLAPIFNKYHIYNKPMCKPDNDFEDTRFTHPIDNYRELTLFDYYLNPHVFSNPQNEITQLVYSGINSRLEAKDCYKPPKTEQWEDYTAFPPYMPFDNNYMKDLMNCLNK